MSRPSLVVNYRKVFREFFQLIFSNMLRTKFRICRAMSMPRVKFLWLRISNLQPKTNLIVIISEPILLEQLLIIRRIIVHAIQRRLTSLYDQSPTAITLSKIDWPIHCTHTLLHQPMLRDIKKHIRRLLTVDAIEESDASHRNLITLVLIFLVYKCRNSAEQFTLLRTKYPTPCFSMAKCLVLRGIENIIHILIQWPDVIGIILVEPHVYINEQLCRLAVRYFNQFHPRKLINSQVCPAAIYLNIFFASLASCPYMSSL